MDHGHLRPGRASLVSAFQATEEVVQLLMHKKANRQLVLQFQLLSHLMFHAAVTGQSCFSKALKGVISLTSFLITACGYKCKRRLWRAGASEKKKVTFHTLNLILLRILKPKGSPASSSRS